MIRTLLLASVALSMSSAAFAQDVSVLRIGLDGGENEADQLRRSECVAEPLKAATGVSEVQFFPSPDYNGVIQGLLGGTIDIAIMGASSYAAIYLQDENAVDPVLTTQQEDGSTGYHTIMVARADSGITDLASTEGKTLGFADPDSTSGYLIPSVALPTELGKPIDEFYAETASAAAMKTSSSAFSTASSTSARLLVRARANFRKATLPAISASWSTRASSTWMTSSKSGRARSSRTAR